MNIYTKIKKYNESNKKLDPIIKSGIATNVFANLFMDELKNKKIINNTDLLNLDIKLLKNVVDYNNYLKYKKKNKRNVELMKNIGFYASLAAGVGMIASIAVQESLDGTIDDLIQKTQEAAKDVTSRLNDFEDVGPYDGTSEIRVQIPCQDGAEDGDHCPIWRRMISQNFSHTEHVDVSQFLVKNQMM